MGRTLVFGDIHGGLKALQQLINRAKIDIEDTLIFLGDYVDGWNDSANVISFLIRLNTTNRCVFLKGNHDQLCYDWLITKKDNPKWLAHGGLSTIAAYKTISLKEIDTHLEFYQCLKDYYIDDQNRLFLHAGFTNLKGPAYEYFPKMCYWDRTLWETALALDPSIQKTDILYPKRLLLFPEVYIGHTPVTRIGKTTPVKATCVWNLDTGAAFKGSLTCMDINSKEFWQSDPVYTLYPNENGRN